MISRKMFVMGKTKFFTNLEEYTKIWKNKRKTWKITPLRKKAGGRKVLEICGFYREKSLFCLEKLVVFCVFY